MSMDDTIREAKALIVAGAVAFLAVGFAAGCWVGKWVGC